MVKIKYTQELIGMMSIFSKIAKVTVKDCFEDNLNVLTFVVDHTQLGRAIGKKAVTIKRLEQLFKRKIRVIGFYPEIELFVRNVVYPLHVESVEREENILYLKDPDKKTKSLLIGRNAQNLRNTEAIVQRYFVDVTEIKVM